MQAAFVPDSGLFAADLVRLAVSSVEPSNALRFGVDFTGGTLDANALVH